MSMLKLSLEELSALNLILKFMTVEELVAAAGDGFAERDQNVSTAEKSDLCWKVLKTLRD
jgi:hypothetical protein